MAQRAVLISVSVALGHTSANAVRATAGAGPLVAPRVKLSHSILLCRAPKEKAVSTIFKVFDMTRPRLEPTTKADALPLGHHTGLGKRNRKFKRKRINFDFQIFP